MATHAVENQPPPLENVNVFVGDRALVEAFAREAPQADDAPLRALGALAGAPETIALGFAANVHPPELRTHDRFGHRIDEVAFHPAYHELMRLATAHGLHGTPWCTADDAPHVRRAAGFYLWSQVESGHGCPISMTYAAVPALRMQPSIAAAWEPHLTARAYVPQLAPVAAKGAALCGMGMTEKQGGSDVRANATRATALGARGPGEPYALTGHKWFCSAPMCDAFLVLAQSDAGLGCFFVPRILPDGTRNPFALMRLKDKLGNRSNASSEVEFAGTVGWLIGDEDAGVRTILEMVNCTRLDCIVGSAALLRQALAQAIHHARYRTTFGRLLIDHPAMENVLADLALESEAATVLFMRLARCLDANEHPLKRIGTAIGKYYVCKRAPTVVGEALECLGGNGYVEESILPRLYREAPLNSIWEGSGNINALDVVRICAKEPDALEALRAEIASVRRERAIAASLRELERLLRDPDARQARARAIAERLALLWQAALLVRFAPSAVADAFVASRVAGDWGHTLGTLPSGTPPRRLIDRAAPEVPQ